MTIDAGGAVGMLYVKSVAEAVQTDGYSLYITFGNSKERLALDHLRADIDAAMKMVRARFSEISRQRNGEMNG
jgi:hypothetical protein